MRLSPVHVFSIAGLFAGAFAACSSSSSSGNKGETSDASTSGEASPTSDDSSTGAITEAGSGSDGSVVLTDLPSIDGGVLVSTLPSAELGELCDWLNHELGIYDATVMCPPNNEIIPTTRSACIAGLSYVPTCRLTVEQLENCVAVELPSQGCDTPGPDCSTMLECLTKPDAGM